MATEQDVLDVVRTYADERVAAAVRPIPGTYVPGPTTTGLLTDKSALTVVRGRQTLSRGGEIRNIWFPDGVVLAAPHTFRNVAFGPPRNPSTATACVVGDNANGLYGSVFEDFLIDGEGSSAWVNGIFATNCTLRRGEITGVTDCIDFLYQCPQPTLTEGNWLHDTKLWRNVPGVNSDGVTHNDGGQFHRGKHITMRGDFIDQVQSQAIMIKQEVSTSAADKLEDILLDRVFFGGGWYNAGLKVHFDRGNDLSGVTIVEPVFTQVQPKPYIVVHPSTRPHIIRARMADGTPVASEVLR